jgi:hypothetical protein
VADHWIQVNFHGVTHLQRITFHAIRDQGTITQAWMEVSRNGIDWTPVVVVSPHHQPNSSSGKHVSAIAAVLAEWQVIFVQHEKQGIR